MDEQRDSFVGLMLRKTPAKVRALVQQVNEQRRLRYQQFAPGQQYE
ncbi:MAG: DUF1318 domain-containing protein [Pseudomonadales bacterium]|nr:DUF1318 domain-containing protein [Pseudomonadales bacterium]